MRREIDEVPVPSGAEGRRLRHLGLVAPVSVWVAPVCADAANRPGPWLWAAVAATGAALALVCVRARLRRGRYAENPV
jgi:hypothetical protein